jgi:hypothetical protein
MPALPNVPNTVRVDLNWEIGTDLHVGTKFYFQYDGDPPDVSGVLDIGDAVAASWAAHLQDLSRTGIICVETVVTDINSEDGLRAIVPIGENGTLGGAVLPQSICGLVNHTVAARYRGGKPRSYPPIGSADTLASPAQWESSFITSVNAGWAAFTAALIGVEFDTTTLTQYGAVSYYQGVQPPVTLPSGRVKQASKPRTTPAFLPIVTSTLNPNLGTQRRRIRA